MNVFDWAQNARVGDRIVYHRGPLGSLGCHHCAQGQRASERGLVFLSHRRVGSEEGQYGPVGVFAYEATRISTQTARVLGLTGRPGGGVLAEVHLPRLTHPMVLA